MRESEQTELLFGFFCRPTPRFIAGFVFACFCFFPVMWVLLGPPDSLFFLAPIVAVGILGGVWWMRRPPVIFYKPPPEVHGQGVYNRPVVRFLAGFLFACIFYIPIVWIIRGAPTLSILPSMVGLGIVCGLMGVRRSAALFTSGPPTS